MNRFPNYFLAHVVVPRFSRHWFENAEPPMPLSQRGLKSRATSQPTRT